MEHVRVQQISPPEPLHLSLHKIIRFMKDALVLLFVLYFKEKLCHYGNRINVQIQPFLIFVFVGVGHTVILVKLLLAFEMGHCKNKLRQTFVTKSLKSTQLSFK